MFLGLFSVGKLKIYRSKFFSLGPNVGRPNVKELRVGQSAAGPTGSIKKTLNWKPAATDIIRK
jgi:hypothetical protein